VRHLTFVASLHDCRTVLSWLFQFVLMFAMASTVQSSYAQSYPSFKCEKADKPVEKKVCDTPDLARLDGKMDAAYRYMMSTVSDKEERNAITLEQRKWLVSLTACGGENVECLQRRYERRIKDFQIDCVTPSTENETRVCAANDARALQEIVKEMWEKWRPYVSQLNISGTDDEQRFRLGYDQLLTRYLTETRSCLSMQCHRSKTKQFLDHECFPREAYDRLRSWITSPESASTLLNSGLWTLDDKQATPAWGIVSQQIYLMGEVPSWFQQNSEDSDADSTAPFMTRPLSKDELSTLRRLVRRAPNHWYGRVAEDVPILGVSPSALESILVSDGGSAKCSANPFASGIYVNAAALKSLLIRPNEYSGGTFKIIEIRTKAEKQRTPTCALSAPLPKGFIPSDSDHYTSNVFIDQIQSVFVRADGTFWLRLSDDNWYRFRSDMTSDAPAIGKTFHVLKDEEFTKLLNRSRTLRSFERNLIGALQKH